MTLHFYPPPPELRSRYGLGIVIAALGGGIFFVGLSLGLMCSWLIERLQ